MGMSGTTGAWNGRSVAIPDFVFDGKTTHLPPRDYPGRRLPEPILHMFREHRASVENATEIRIRRDEMSMGVTIAACCGNQQWIHLTITDETLCFLNIDPGTLAPPLLPLPTLVSQYPILGWRQWRIEMGMFGFHGKRWDTPLHVAECIMSPGDVPHDRCRCGVYIAKYLPQYLDAPYYALGLVVAERVVEHEHGYRAGIARCIAIDKVHPEAYGWDGIPIMSLLDLRLYEQELHAFPTTIPYPNDSPAP